MNIWYVIPARKGSKGLPFKNRMLLSNSLNKISDDMKETTIISSDDEFILNKSRERGFIIQARNTENATDEASTREVLIEVAEKQNMLENDIIVALYLTFSERKNEHIETALKMFHENDAKSLLCRTDPETHPYLCLYSRSGHRGEKIVEHDLYRRQDYPECFMVSHYVAIFLVSELKELNKNLYNKETIYFPMDNTPVDVDEIKDLQQ